ncbi:putative oxidoreductase [Aminobacter niigataensis]|uniref:Oxidoreductase n=1 Tax=Aminobacter niigataensis TaxID=83265 RepID=A0ABR6LAD0_9HYPH|nr:hypothetical protein [Aminobacter niigataensis]MBB4652965.1 putative oxidoreductase [Aminobacter niigataensis]
MTAQPSPTNQLSPKQLHELAVDAFDVLNWARRIGMKREQQIEQVARTFEVTLGYRPAAVRPE